jgi:hypothetical protein
VAHHRICEEETMDEHERSTLEPDEAPQPRTERLMRRTLLALCLVGTVFGSPAAADLIELTSGQTSQPLPPVADLTLFGDQFALVARIGIPGGIIFPSAELIVGTTVTVRAAWSGGDAAPGVYTYRGQTVPVGPGAHEASLYVQFLSNPFVVPPLDGSPVATVPFTLTGIISPTLIPSPRLDLHGTGTMTAMFFGPHPDHPIFGDVWENIGQVQWFVTTPEPSAIILVATALGGFGVCAWSRRRSRLPDTVDPRGPKGK